MPELDPLAPRLPPCRIVFVGIEDLLSTCRQTSAMMRGRLAYSSRGNSGKMLQRRSYAGRVIVRPGGRLDSRTKRFVLRFIPFVFFRLGLFRLWQRLPRSARRRIVDRLTVIPDSAFDASPSRAEPPFVVCGMATSHASFGWSMRSMLDHLEALGHEPIALDVSSYFWTDAKKSRRERRPHARVPRSGTLILNVNPDQMNYVCSIIPKQWMAGKYRIGYCVWELETIPPSWHAGLASIHEVWVPSTFVRDAFVNSGIDKPIRVIPHRLKLPAGLTDDRARFGLPEERFIVLTVLNLRSGLARKNPAATIEAFRQAFGGDDAALLVVKVHDGHLSPGALRRLRDMVAGNRNMRLIEEDLSEGDIWKLVASCDCVLSLHRAEGFGLVLKQGLMLDKPTVATGWSGNMDFMTGENAYPVPYRLVPVEDPDGIYPSDMGARWAEPDVAAAAEILRGLFREGAAAPDVSARAVINR